MVALAGLPPTEFVKRSETTEQCFDSGGKCCESLPSIDSIGVLIASDIGGWIAHGDAIVPSESLESLERRLEAPEKEQFLKFIRSMLQWLPEKRRTARELLQDPWLQ